MDAGQLWETTMDPSRRTLLRVTINDMEMYHETCQTFSILMGDEVEPRKISFWNMRSIFPCWISDKGGFCLEPG